MEKQSAQKPSACGFDKKEASSDDVEMVIVGRHINGICLNPLEYLLDETGDIKKFVDEAAAKMFLKEQGYKDEDIEWFVFKTFIFNVC